MKKISLEKCLIEHCAPTLAGLKSANLFNYFESDRAIILSEVNRINRELNARGVYLKILLWRENSALIYVYRQSILYNELNDTDVKEFLAGYGYTEFNTESSIAHLEKRLSESECFPHEIGVFLGYPLMDVIGFIKNKGKNCTCCGPWKVYCNEYEAMRKFEKLRKCTDIYMRVFESGRSIVQMTVSI